MELKPLGAVAAAEDEVIEAAAEVALEGPVADTSLPFVEHPQIAIVLTWLEECKASAPRPDHKAFDEHLYENIDRLRELFA